MKKWFDSTYPEEKEQQQQQHTLYPDSLIKMENIVTTFNKQTFKKKSKTLFSVNHKKK